MSLLHRIFQKLTTKYFFIKLNVFFISVIFQYEIITCPSTIKKYLNKNFQFAILDVVFSANTHEIGQSCPIPLRFVWNTVLKGSFVRWSWIRDPLFDISWDGGGTNPFIFDHSKNAVWNGNDLEIWCQRDAYVKLFNR